MSTNRNSLNYYSFNPQATAFEKDNALLLAKYASLVYQNREVVEIILKEVWGFQEIQYIEGFSDTEDIQVYMAIKEDVILVAFRCLTEQKPDWNPSTNYSLDNFLEGKAHRGFGQALNLVWQRILETLVVQRNGQKIWLCGHSLGGVLAVMAANLFTSKSIPIQGIYTFGQPRAGDKIFAQITEEKIPNSYYRIINQEDYVCSLPTEWQGYAHAGKPIVLNALGEIIISKQEGESSSFWQDTYSWGNSFYNWGKESLLEHSIEVYIERLAMVNG